MNDDEKAWVVAEYQAGKSAAHVAGRYGCSTTSVLRWVRADGYAPRSRERRRTAKRVKWDCIRCGEAQESYTYSTPKSMMCPRCFKERQNVCGMPFTSDGRRARKLKSYRGLLVCIVKSRCVRCHAWYLPSHKGQNYCTIQCHSDKDRIRPSEDDLRRLCEYWGQQKRVAKALGVHPLTVAKWCQRYGIKAVRRKPVTVSHRGPSPSCNEWSPSKELRLYWQRKTALRLYGEFKNCQTVADAMGVSYPTAYSYVGHAIQAVTGTPCRPISDIAGFYEPDESRKARIARIRGCSMYSDWRDDVLAASRGRCVWCERPARDADHITPFLTIVAKHNLLDAECDADFMDAVRKCNALWDRRNGRALCLPCHKRTESYGTGRQNDRQLDLL